MVDIQVSVIYRIYSSYFHNMGFAYQPLFGKMSAATEIKPNHNENIHFVLLTRFIFASAAREQKANKRKLNISELWNRS